MKRFIYIVCLFFLIFACSKSSVDDSNPEGENPDGIDNPSIDNSVELYFPQENMLCNLGTNVTPTESTVKFEWKANDADNYKITIENLFDGNIITQETTTDTIPIVLQRATPYKWFVESQKGSKTQVSEIWQFYNAGPGEQSYAPFPAVINSPVMAASIPSTSSVTLQWTGSDVDDDIAGYDIYIGNNSNPPLFSSDLNTNELVVTVSSGIYYWKVITKDALGNTSDSGIFQFRVL